nr:hypothetical protein [uncultured Mediterraneibacter sp.]
MSITPLIGMEDARIVLNVSRHLKSFFSDGQVWFKAICIIFYKNSKQFMEKSTFFTKRKTMG